MSCCEPNITLLIKMICEKAAQKANSSLSSVGLTTSQLQLLGLVMHAPDCTLSFKEAEAALGMAQSTVAGLAARLAAKDFVACTTAENDRRRKYLQLTEKGREFMEEGRAKVKESDAQLLSQLSPEEQKEFRRMLLLVLNSI